MSKRRVTYYYDPDVGSYTYGYGHLMKPQRMRITHELVSAYGMLDKMHVLRAKRASAETMTRFHTDEYIDFLSKVTPENVEELMAQRSRFLVLGDDNPAFEGIFEFCSISAGGSLAAAERIAGGATDIAINWAGGLHHAKKREASGFCFINDIVLCILELLRSVPRVLYIDIDCHHGDGVEEAFYTTNRVMTCSFHKYGEFFPGTGTLQDRGRGKGKGYAVNVPLKDGITDESFRSVFEPVIDKILAVFNPSVVVLQCGADSLAGDRLGCLNLTMEGHASCIKYVRARNVPLIETACALGIEREIDPTLPWNEYFEWFGPRYRLEVLPNNMEDMNVKDGSLEEVRLKVLEYLSDLQPVPSVGLQDVPRESVGQHLGFGSAMDAEPMDELDERLAQHTRFVYDLQEATVPDNESDQDDAESLSDDSSASRRRRGPQHNSRRRTRKRMSIVTNRYFDVPRLGENGEESLPDLCAGAYANGNGNGTKHSGRRRFFESAARWDPVVEKVLAEWDSVRSPRMGVAAVMANQGRDWSARNGYGRDVGEEQEEGADEEMEVDDEEGEKEG